MPRKTESSTGPISAQAQQDLVSEGIENFELPKSIVTRIAKSALNSNARLSQDVTLSLVKSSTVFINYLAATAHDVALSKQHKSISASDVLKALELIEFGDLVDMLQQELLVYREKAKTDKSKRGSSNVGPASAPAVKAKPAAASTSASVSAAVPLSTPSGLSISINKGKGKAKLVGDREMEDIGSASAGPTAEHLNMSVDGEDDEEEDEVEEVDEYEGEGEGELVDAVGMEEEEELRRDEGGLEEYEREGHQNPDK